MAISAYGWIDRLRPYRRRLRIALAWRLGAIGGMVGALTGTLLSLLDWRAILLIPTYWLPLTVVLGIVVGVLYALLIRVPDSAVAQLIDRRAGLKDRVQTALEYNIPPLTGGIQGGTGSRLFDEPLLEDALNALSATRPAEVFRLRFGFPQRLFVGAVALMVLMHFLPQLLAVAIPERREQQKEIQQTAKQVEEVAKPILEEAKKPDADELAKRIAENVELFNRRAREAKMDKREALLRYNQLMEDARKLEQKTAKKMEQITQKSLTAGEQLKQLAEKHNQELSNAMQGLQEQLNQLQHQLDTSRGLQGRPLTAQQRTELQNRLRQLQATMQALQNPTAQNLQNQMNDLQRQLEELQKQLQSGKDAQGNPLTQEQIEQLKKQIEQLQQQIRALKLSEQAREFLRKLYNDPAFKEAMEHLRKLAEEMRKNQQNQQNQQNANNQQNRLSPEEIEKRLQELEKKLEELAEKYKTDEQIHELAKQILEQVKQLKELNQCQGACQGICMGLGMGLGMGGAMGTKNPHAWDKGEFVGQPEMFNQGDKQPELKIPMKDTPITGSQPLLPGPAEYTEFQAPPTPGSSSVPLNKALPTYQKKAEQALSQQNIPPAERKRVKRYFESLQSGGK